MAFCSGSNEKCPNSKTILDFKSYFQQTCTFKIMGRVGKVSKESSFALDTSVVSQIELMQPGQ